MGTRTRVGTTLAQLASDRWTAVLLTSAAGIAVYPVGLLLGLAPTLARHVVLFAVAFLAYLIAVAAVLRIPAASSPLARTPAPDLPNPIPHDHQSGSDPARAHLLLVLGGAIALRLATLATQPALSDDLYRYIWDGTVLLHGINPYRFPPAAPELAWLRAPLWTPINAKDLTTPYPPAAQLIFALTAAVAGASVKAQQVVALVGDLLVIGALALLLRQLGLPTIRLLIYAWNPLTLMHAAHSAHNDGWMIAPLLLALVATEAHRPALAALALAFGVLVKLFVGIALTALAARWRRRDLALFGGIVALGFAPFAIGANPLRGVLFEAGAARFNESLYYGVEKLLIPLTPRASGLTGPAMGAVLVGVSIVGWWQVRRGRSTVDVAFALIGAFLLCSPVVEPWYVLWILPFVALRLGPGRPWAWTPAAGWLLFSGLVVLTELTYTGSFRHAWPIIRAAEYAPLYGVLAWSTATLTGLRPFDTIRQRVSGVRPPAHRVTR